MKLFDFANQQIKKMNVWDIGMLKWCLFLIGLVVGAFFPIFVKTNLTIIIILIAILWVALLWKFLKK